MANVRSIPLTISAGVKFDRKILEKTLGKDLNEVVKDVSNGKGKFKINLNGFVDDNGEPIDPKTIAKFEKDASTQLNTVIKAIASNFSEQAKTELADSLRDSLTTTFDQLFSDMSKDILAGISTIQDQISNSLGEINPSKAASKVEVNLGNNITVNTEEAKEEIQKSTKELRKELNEAETNLVNSKKELDRLQKIKDKNFKKIQQTSGFNGFWDDKTEEEIKKKTKTSKSREKYIKDLIAEREKIFQDESSLSTYDDDLKKIDDTLFGALGLDNEEIQKYLEKSNEEFAESLKEGYQDYCDTIEDANEKLMASIGRQIKEQQSILQQSNDTINKIKEDKLGKLLVDSGTSGEAVVEENEKGKNSVYLHIEPTLNTSKVVKVVRNAVEAVQSGLDKYPLHANIAPPDEEHMSEYIASVYSSIENYFNDPSNQIDININTQKIIDDINTALTGANINIGNASIGQLSANQSSDIITNSNDNISDISMPIDLQYKVPDEEVADEIIDQIQNVANNLPIDLHYEVPDEEVVGEIIDQVQKVANDSPIDLHYEVPDSEEEEYYRQMAEEHKQAAESVSEAENQAIVEKEQTLEDTVTRLVGLIESIPHPEAEDAYKLLQIYKQADKLKKQGKISEDPNLRFLKKKKNLPNADKVNDLLSSNSDFEKEYKLREHSLKELIDLQRKYEKYTEVQKRIDEGKSVRFFDKNTYQSYKKDYAKNEDKRTALIRVLNEFAKENDLSLGDLVAKQKETLQETHNFAVQLKNEYDSIAPHLNEANFLTEKGVSERITDNISRLPEEIQNVNSKIEETQTRLNELNNTSYADDSDEAKEKIALEEKLKSLEEEKAQIKQQSSEEDRKEISYLEAQIERDKALLSDIQQNPEKYKQLYEAEIKLAESAKEASQYFKNYSLEEIINVFNQIQEKTQRALVAAQSSYISANYNRSYTSDEYNKRYTKGLERSRGEIHYSDGNVEYTSKNAYQIDFNKAKKEQDYLIELYSYYDETEKQKLKQSIEEKKKEIEELEAYPKDRKKKVTVSLKQDNGEYETKEILKSELKKLIEDKKSELAKDEEELNQILEDSTNKIKKLEDDRKKINKEIAQLQLQLTKGITDNQKKAINKEIDQKKKQRSHLTRLINDLNDPYTTEQMVREKRDKAIAKFENIKTQVDDYYGSTRAYDRERHGRIYNYQSYKEAKSQLAIKSRLKKSLQEDNKQLDPEKDIDKIKENNNKIAKLEKSIAGLNVSINNTEDDLKEILSLIEQITELKSELAKDDLSPDKKAEISLKISDLGINLNELVGRLGWKSYGIKDFKRQYEKENYYKSLKDNAVKRNISAELYNGVSNRDELIANIDTALAQIDKDDKDLDVKERSIDATLSSIEGKLKRSSSQSNNLENITKRLENNKNLFAESSSEFQNTQKEIEHIISLNAEEQLKYLIENLNQQISDVDAKKISNSTDNAEIASLNQKKQKLVQRLNSSDLINDEIKIREETLKSLRTNIKRYQHNISTIEKQLQDLNAFISATVEKKLAEDFTYNWNVSKKNAVSTQRIYNDDYRKELLKEKLGTLFEGYSSIPADQLMTEESKKIGLNLYQTAKELYEQFNITLQDVWSERKIDLLSEVSQYNRKLENANTPEEADELRSKINKINDYINNLSNAVASFEAPSDSSNTDLLSYFTKQIEKFSLPLQKYISSMSSEIDQRFTSQIAGKENQIDRIDSQIKEVDNNIAETQQLIKAIKGDKERTQRIKSLKKDIKNTQQAIAEKQGGVVNVGIDTSLLRTPTSSRQSYLEEKNLFDLRKELQAQRSDIAKKLVEIYKYDVQEIQKNLKAETDKDIRSQYQNKLAFLRNKITHINSNKVFDAEMALYQEAEDFLAHKNEIEKLMKKVATDESNLSEEERQRFEEILQQTEKFKQNGLAVANINRTRRFDKEGNFKGYRYDSINPITFFKGTDIKEVTSGYQKYSAINEQVGKFSKSLEQINQEYQEALLQEFANEYRAYLETNDKSLLINMQKIINDYGRSYGKYSQVDENGKKITLSYNTNPKDYEAFEVSNELRDEMNKLWQDVENQDRENRQSESSKNEEIKTLEMKLAQAENDLNRENKRVLELERRLSTLEAEKDRLKEQKSQLNQDKKALKSELKSEKSALKGQEYSTDQSLSVGQREIANKISKEPKKENVIEDNTNELVQSQQKVQEEVKETNEELKEQTQIVQEQNAVAESSAVVEEQKEVKEEAEKVNNELQEQEQLLQKVNGETASPVNVEEQTPEVVKEAPKETVPVNVEPHIANPEEAATVMSQEMSGHPVDVDISASPESKEQLANTFVNIAQGANVNISGDVHIDDAQWGQLNEYTSKLSDSILGLRESLNNTTPAINAIANTAAQATGNIIGDINSVANNLNTTLDISEVRIKDFGKNIKANVLGTDLTDYSEINSALDDFQRALNSDKRLKELSKTSDVTAKYKELVVGSDSEGNNIKHEAVELSALFKDVDNNLIRVIYDYDTVDGRMLDVSVASATLSNAFTEQQNSIKLAQQQLNYFSSQLDKANSKFNEYGLNEFNIVDGELVGNTERSQDYLSVITDRVKDIIVKAIEAKNNVNNLFEKLKTDSEKGLSSEAFKERSDDFALAVDEYRATMNQVNRNYTVGIEHDTRKTLEQFRKQLVREQSSLFDVNGDIIGFDTESLSQEGKNYINVLKDLLTQLSNLYSQFKKQDIFTDEDRVEWDRIVYQISDTKKKMRAPSSQKFINGKGSLIEGMSIEPDVFEEMQKNASLAKRTLGELAQSINENEIEIGYLSNQNKSLSYSYKDVNGNVQDCMISVDNLGGSIRNLVRKSSPKVSLLSKVFGGLKDKMFELGKYFSAYQIFYKVINAFRSGISIVKELDTAMTEMRKVSNDTEADLQKFAKASHQVAQEIGSTAAVIQNSAADWMRLGYSIKDAAELSKNTAVLMNVSEFDSIDAATESMVAMVQAFKDANKDVGELSLEIIDKLNNVGNNFSISTSDLAKSLQRSSGALIAAGNDLDEAIALTTAANAIIQDPESTGSALKVISMRLRGTSVKELEEAGEDTEGVIETVSKLESKIKELTAINGQLGVSILDANGNYRDTYEILQDIADIWEEIGEADKKDGQNRQAALLEAMAGKTRSQSLASLLQNPDMLRQVYEASKVSEGSAQKENEKYLESIEAHVQILTAKWQEFWNSALNRKQINAVLDLASKLLDVANKLGALPSAGILVGGGIGLHQLLFKKKKGSDNGIFSIFKTLFQKGLEDVGADGELERDAGDALGNLLEGAAENVSESAGEVAEEITSQISETLKAHDGGIDVTDQIFDIDSAKDAGDEIADLMEDIAEEQVGASEIITNAKAAETVATVTNTGAVNAETGSKAKNTTENIKETASVWALVKAKLAEAKARAAAFAATPLGMAAIAAAIIAIGYATTKLVLWLKSADHAIEKSKKLREEAQNLAQSLKEEADNASETAKSFRELADSYEEAIAGSEEYYNIANQIAELDPTLVVGYTSNGDAILADTSAIYEQVNAYEALSKAKADASKEAADELIKTDVEQYDILNQKKTDNDQKIKEQKELLDSYYQHLNSLTEGTAQYNKYKNDLIPAQEDIYQNLLNESKKYSEEIQNINNELAENYTYLFDEFDETLSQSEQETEKHLRQFVSNIGRESHLSPDQFRDLYAKAGLVNEKLWDELFSIKNEDLNEEQYRETAQNLYNKIINELTDKGFQLDKNGQATLKVMLGIDEKSIVNNNQRTKNFANKYFKGFDRSNDNARARDWYDQLIGSDKDIVDKATDFADILKQVENDHPGNTLVQNLDLALEKTKKISEEIKTINADFTPQDLSEKVTSQLTSIESLYGTFYENILNGSKTRLDLDDVEGLRSNIVKSDDNPLGVEIEQFEKFERVVSDGTHSVKEMQDAFDTLSTQFVDNALALEGYTEENEALIKSQLELAGYTKESVDKYVDFKRAIYECNQQFKISEDGLHLDFANEQSRQKFLKNAHDAINKMHEETQKQSKMYGNVDIYQRPIIDNRDGSYSTTSTANMTYDSKNGNGELINIHATPILPNGEVWTDEKLDEYLSGIIKEATSNSDILEKDKVENGGWGLIYQVDTTTMINGKKEPITAENLENAIMEGNAVDTAIHEVQDKIYSDEAELTVAVHIVEEGGDLTLQQLMLVAQYSDLAKDELLEYYVTKLTADALTMSTAADCEQLANELEQLGINCTKLREYIALKSMAESVNISGGNTAAYLAESRGKAALGEAPTTANDALTQVQNSLNEKIKLVNDTTKEAAGGGGKEAGDAYVEAFEKELQELDDLKEAGIISEREYLERLRDLNQRYFKDKAQYAKEYAKYEKQYLQGMSDLYNNAISGAISVLNFQKNKLEKERDKAVKALEKERDAAIKPVQDQIDALEDEQKALEKERDAMQKANDERERAINLQKAQYELERANAQRTRLIYKNGQMQYVNDYQEVRDAKKNLEDALFDEKMAKMDEQIDNINEQIEGFNDQLDEINKHYDDLIKSTEEFYDEQIEQLQDMIDMWEEFQAQMELSEALAALDEFGITMDDILSGNPEAFAKLTQGYAACQAALTGNISEIAQALGTSEEKIRRWIEKIGDDFQNAFSGDIDTSGIDKISNAITGGGGGGASTGAGAGAGTGSGSTGGGLVGDIQTLSGGVQDLNTNLGAINSVPMENLANSIERIVDVLGEEGFAGLFKMPENFNLADIVKQFTTMNEAIASITTAITGGGGQSKGTTDWSDNTDYHSEGGGESGEEGDTLLSALEQVGEKQADIQALSDTFAPEDGSLSSNVETAGKAISDEKNEDSLTGKFVKLKEKAEENVNPVVEMFEMLLMQITMCVTAVEQLTNKMITLKDVNINGVGGGGDFSGTAYASGNWSAKSKGANGVALTGELGEELVVDSKTGRWHTVGSNGAEFAKIKPNDIVFNHRQTEQLLKNGKINSRGRAYASGNNNRFTSLTPEELSKYNKLDFTKDLAEKLDFGNQKLMNIDKTVSTISNNKTVNNNPVINVNNPTFTCTGVTGEEVLAQIQREFTGLFTNAYQQSMSR